MIKRYTIFILFFSTVVHAAVSYPDQFTLNPGEKTSFKFAIDAALFKDPLLCTIESPTTTSPLIINFKETQVQIEAGKRKFIEGDIKVPKDTSPNTYKETFCVSCDPQSSTQGTTTKPRYCDIPIRVIVEESKSTLTNLTKIWSIVLIIANIILGLIVLLLFLKRRKQNPFQETKPPSP